ncbi:MAG: zinc metallopeptidase [Actinobacteria bacterium]|nr:zinc metallopeptidase [Actinomycetota bacterium]
MFYFWDITFLMLIPALIFSIYAQIKVRTSFNRYSQIANSRGMTGAQAAQQILSANGVNDVKLDIAPGALTDHYDPRSRTLRLSRDIFFGKSISALGIAAHESGHAIQHANKYGPLMLRNTFYPVANIGSVLAFPLFIMSFLFSFRPLIDIGIIAFTAAVIFTLITLPVEFNASKRAVQALETYGLLGSNELPMAKSVLNAAAMTYIAATAMALLQLLRLLILRNRS